MNVCVKNLIELLALPLTLCLIVQEKRVIVSVDMKSCFQWHQFLNTILDFFFFNFAQNTSLVKGSKFLLPAVQNNMYKLKGLVI